MRLLTNEMRRRLPALYTTQDDPDPIVQVKFFTPWTIWTWYVTEFDGIDLLFGLVEGFETEWGYSSLAELEAIRGPGGLRIERDLYFEPTRVSDVPPLRRFARPHHVEHQMIASPPSPIRRHGQAKCNGLTSLIP